MRKTLQTLFLILLAVSAGAQITNKVTFLEGNISYSETKFKTSSSFFSSSSFVTVAKSTNINAGMGFTTSEKSAFGFTLGRISNTSSDIKFGLTRIGVFHQKFYELSEKFYFTPRLEFILGFGKSTFFDPSGGGNDTDVDNSEMLIGFLPALQYFINEKWAITALIGSISYSRLKEAASDSDAEIVTKNVDVNLNINSFRLGFQYYLMKKNK
ncbi:hypothetical protein [Ekhidna sp. To15]|uniref:hypothetical protein n=1 Tax=Ekhidna sp. To15 TaxID=3395267 RepID=UPI003F520E49